MIDLEPAKSKAIYEETKDEKMEIQSEKTFYEQDVTEALRTVDADVILWGEDLYDAKIVLYPKKITELPGYAQIKPRLVNAGLVYFNLRAEHFIKCTIVRWDEDTRMVYIAEGNFNSIWKFLRNSVEAGIRIKQKNGEKISVEKAEDIVKLSYLQRKGSEAVLKNGQLVYEAREVPESKKIDLGRKQSALDNQKNKYFYSELEDRYHDKDCERIKEIPPESFRASAAVPQGYKPCSKCRRRIFLREACAPYVKQMWLVDYLLRKQGIGDFNLEKYAFDYGLKFRVDAEGELTVKGEEDTWIIKGFDSGNLSLWHNNYVKTAPRERYITSGFHQQGLKGKKLYPFFEYINDYTFEKHLAAEECIIEKQIIGAQITERQKEEKITETPSKLQNGIPEMERQQEGSRTLFSRFMAFIRKLIGVGRN